MLETRHLKKLAVIICLGMPGLSRLVVLLLIERIYGLNTLGYFAVETGAAYTALFFCGIGWAALLMKELPLLNVIRSYQLLNIVFLISFACCLIAAPILFVCAKFQIISLWMETLLFLGSISLYQIVKHFFLAKKKYFELILIDGCILLTSILALYFAHLSISEILLSLSLINIVTCMPLILRSFYLLKTRSHPLYIYRKSFLRTGSLFGINNVAGGAVVSFLPNVVFYLAGSVYAGFISLILSVVSMLLLLPRSLATYRLPDLVIASERYPEEKLTKLIKQFKKELFVLLMVILVLTTVFLKLALTYSIDTNEVSTPFILSSLLMLFFLVSQFAIVDANYLFARNAQKYLLIGSFGMLFFFAGASIIIQLVVDKNNYKLILLFATLIFASLWKYYYLKNKSQQFQCKGALENN